MLGIAMTAYLLPDREMLIIGQCLACVAAALHLTL